MSPTPREVSSSRSGFIVLPLKLLALYRLDYAAVHWSVPLVPYAKIGLIWEPWWTSLSGKTETNGDGTSEGKGARFGWRREKIRLIHHPLSSAVAEGRKAWTMEFTWTVPLT